jgi:citrate lyase subunit alpha/citrate CoA-transferase
MNFVKNAAGRIVPTEVNGREQVPYKGIGKHRPTGRKYGPPIVSAADYPADGNKLLPNLTEALVRAGLRDGMTISTHHHFRDGDLVALEVFRIAKELKVKDLVWLPSASFPCHEPLIEYLKDGTIHHIEGSMNGPLGRFTSQGKMKGVGVLRSHGGATRPFKTRGVIDIAVIAAPTADPLATATACTAPPPAQPRLCPGRLPVPHKVIVVTDNLVPFPCVPFQVVGNYVDYVCRWTHRHPEKIVSGTTQITRSPDRLYLPTSRSLLRARRAHSRRLLLSGGRPAAPSLSIGIYFTRCSRRRAGRPL